MGRYEEMQYWFPVPADLRSECADFVDWLNEHETEIESQVNVVCLALMDKMDELEGDIRAAVYSGGLSRYAAAALESYYTRGGILQ